MRHACGCCEREEHYDAGGTSGPVCGVSRHDGCGARAASVAAGMDRRAGAALRLLPERDDDPGRRSSGDDEEPVGGSDPHGDERAPVPLWDVSENPDRDPEGRGRDGEGRCMMTGLIPEKEFSRKSLIKTGGALVVGFSIAGAGLAGKASAAGQDPFASSGSPSLAQVDSWLTIHPDNTASVRTGLHEVGGGSSTAMLMIAAEELDMDMSQMRFVRLDTNVSPDQGETSGSNGTRNQGAQLRTAVVAARSALLDLAAASLGVAKGSLTVNKGVVSGGGKAISYGDLLGDKLFNVQIPVGAPTTSFNPTQPGATSINAGGTGAKPISQYKLVGTLVPRIDIPDIVTGNYTYIQNIRIPGMLHGRVIRPRGQGAFGLGTDTPILSVDESSIKHLPNVQIVRVRNFLGVVAPREYDAIQAAAQLKVTWADPPALPSSGNLWKQMRAQDSQGLVRTSVDSSIETIHGLPITAGDVDGALASAAKVLTHTYTFAQQDTVPIGPMCSVAEVTPNGAVIYSNSAYNYQTRQWVKNVLDALLGSQTLPLNRIRIIRYAGSSEYGGRFTSFDAAESAAIMSAVVGKPVRLQLMRWDQHGWNNGWVAHMFDLRGGMDSKGKLVAIEHADFLTPTSHENPDLQLYAIFTANEFIYIIS